MNFLLLMLKGAIIGAANIIPGVSGSTLALILGIYQKLISILGAFWKNIKENIKFLLPIGIGAVLAVLIFSKITNSLLSFFPIATVMFFIGLILGGIPMLYKHIEHKFNAKNVIIFSIIFISLILFSIFNSVNTVSLIKLNFIDYVKLFFVGIISAATMVIPGISGSMVLMNIGYYKPLLETISNLTNINQFFNSCLILFPFGIGVIVGIIVISRIISFCFKHFPTETYFGIFAFVLGSIIGIITQLKATFNIIEVIVGAVLLILGAISAYYLSTLNKEDETLTNEKVSD